jgi:hypothetical protein
MRLLRPSFLLSILLCATGIVRAQTDDKSSASPTVKTFATAPDANGAAASSVNLFTGDVALPMNLISVPGHNGLDVNVSISYSSNVQNQVNVWNKDAPTGILGLGWSLDIPKIITDYKETGNRYDDTYYLVEGGASNRLIRTVSGSDAGGPFYVYEAKNYQFWKIKYYYDGQEQTGYTSGPNKWEITKEDGTKYVYGDKGSGRNTVQWVVRWNNWIGHSAQTTNQSQMATAWNLSEITNLWGEKITFEYANTEQFVGSSDGKKHTEASYLKQITGVLGRRVVFNYLDKKDFKPNNVTSEFYIEPHTEQAEPDAYQEVYEKNYLNTIEVFREDNSKLLTVELGYTALDAGTNTAKMLLRSIVQKNAAGQALPGLQFTYNQTGATKGFLDQITYPTGGTMRYGYTAATIDRSNRDAPTTFANAPSGYKEPKVWPAEDYTVVTWRQLAADNTHTNSARDVKLYVYQWTGEWKEQYLRTVGMVELVDMTGVPSNTDAYRSYDYKDFQVTMQKNFFAVLKRSSGNVYSLFVEYKDEQNRGRWLEFTQPSLDMGPGTPTLFSGENFVGVGTRQDGLTGSTYHTTRLYTFQGNSWKEDILNQSCGDYYYTATNNYFISHNQAICAGELQGQPEFNFHYLSEDKKWGIKTNKLLTFAAAERSYWAANNSFALVVAGKKVTSANPRDIPEYIYRWDLTYTSFYRDDVLGSFDDDWTFMYTPSSSLVGLVDQHSSSVVTAIAARFNGVNWQTTSGIKYYNSFGDDFFIAGINGSTTYRKTYDANNLSSPWQQTAMTFTSSSTMGAGSIASNPLEAGNNCMFVSDKIHIRKPNGTWSPDITLTVPSGYVIHDISLSPLNPLCFTYELWASSGSGSSFYNTRLHFVKNGGSQNFFTSLNGKLSKSLHNPYTVIAFPTSSFFNDTSLKLYRIVNENVTGKQNDYPVTLITANDGTQNQYTAFDYNYLTATMDPSGSVAQYNEVTVIPGSAVATSKPYGYTKTYFYNGLTAAELGAGTFIVDLKWTGIPYATKVYNSNDVLVSTNNTTYTTYSRELKNDGNIKVEIAYYVRPTQSSSTTDGITSTSTQSYDPNTGLVNFSQVDDYNSKGLSHATITRYKYYWEQYDPTRATNILSPVIQTKTSISKGAETVVGVSAVTWKSWNGVMAPYRTYQWKRSGAADFDFATYNVNEPPAAQWFKASQVDGVDATGNVLQMTTR